MRWEIIRKAGTSEKSFRGCKNRTQDLSVTSSRKTTAHHPGPFQFCTATKMEEPVSSSQDSFHCFFLLRWKTVKTVHSGSGIAPGHLHRRPHLRLLLGFESADEVQLERPDQGVAILAVVETVDFFLFDRIRTRATEYKSTTVSTKPPSQTYIYTHLLLSACIIF